MIEPSLRTLPPLASTRELYGGNAGRFPHHHHHYHQSQHIHTPPEEPLQENSGDCLVILPFSRSAFRGSQQPNKCECSSFFMSPGDPSVCLCGHPASCHSTGSSSSEASSSNESSPYLSSMPLFTAGYTGSMLSPPASVQHPSPTRSNSHSAYHHDDPGLMPAVLAQLAQLEKRLASEIQARQILQEKQHSIQLTQQRLSQQTRSLSEKLDLIIAKSGESARESLDLEVLHQKQRRMVEDMEGLKGAIEGLDERTEDLEFRNEDLEKWVEEQKEERKNVATERRSGREMCERDDEDEHKPVVHKENGAPRRRPAVIAPMATAVVQTTSQSSKRRRPSLSDSAPPSYESSCFTPSIHNMITGTITSSPTVANKRLRHSA